MILHSTIVSLCTETSAWEKTSFTCLDDSSRELLRTKLFISWATHSYRQSADEVQNNELCKNNKNRQRQTKHKDSHSFFCSCFIYSDFQTSVLDWLATYYKLGCLGRSGRCLNTWSWAGMGGWRHLFWPQHAKQFSWFPFSHITSFLNFQWRWRQLPLSSSAFAPPPLSRILCNLFRPWHALLHVSTKASLEKPCLTITTRAPKIKLNL